MAPRVRLRTQDTVRKFAFEIVTITSGILIALWIDGIKDTRRDQALVRTGREQLTREVADNLRDVEGTAPSPDARAMALMNGLQFMAVVATGADAAVPTRADLDAARVQGMALMGSFRFYHELMTQPVRKYGLVQTR